MRRQLFGDSNDQFQPCGLRLSRLRRLLRGYTGIVPLHHQKHRRSLGTLLDGIGQIGSSR